MLPSDIIGHFYYISDIGMNPCTDTLGICMSLYFSSRLNFALASQLG